MAGNKGRSGRKKHNYAMVDSQQTVDAAAIDAGKGDDMIDKGSNVIGVIEQEGNNGNMVSRYIGATLAIVAMWLVVLFVGLHGPGFVVSHVTTINTAVILAPFAMGGTIALAINGYRS